jgi:serine/threonine protein kinase
MEPEDGARRVLGDFELVRPIGRGGMGVVYEARQVSLNRRVALKVLNGTLGLSHKAVVRFRREAEAAARLHHTNIVPVYTTGEGGGAHFYAMELIEGPSLDQVLARLRDGSREKPSPSASPWLAETAAHETETETQTAPHPPAADGPAMVLSSALDSGSGGDYFDTVARMVSDVADALDYAHRNGVIHRDIKPSNLLLSSAGRLSLNDFGLARVLEQPGMTMTGEFVGTPMYMSPEQISAGRAPLDHRTDIYSLGATLYEMLTLQPPFTGERREQVIAKIVFGEPASPRQINKWIPIDLETICLKALEKDPDRRYQTAGALAEDLRRFVNRYAIAARRTGPVGRLAKWVRRRPALAAALGGVVLALAVTGALAVHLGQTRSQLTAERRQNAIDRALLIAMSGDLEAAEQSIREAELLGASTGWVRLLRGQVAYHRGEYNEAVGHLEQAVRLLPDNVAARAILGAALMDTHDWDRVEILQREVERLPMRTAEDALYRGHLDSYMGSDPSRGLVEMDAAIRRRDSPLARVLRTKTRAFAAIDKKDRVLAEQAIDDAAVARSLMPGNPVANEMSAVAYLCAALVAGQDGRPEDRRSYLEKAGKEAHLLKGTRPSINSGSALAWYYLVIGDRDAELAFLRDASRRNPMMAPYLALTLDRHGRTEEALAVLDQLEPSQKAGSEALTFRSFILVSQPNAPEQVAPIVKNLIAQTGLQSTAILSPWPYLLIGRKAEADAFWRRLRAQKRNWPQRDGWYNHALDYECGRLTADELIALAGSSRLNLCEAHHMIGLQRLAAGDRDAAKAHFRKAVATDVFFFVEYNLSHLWLAHLDRDPAWPHWIK